MYQALADFVLVLHFGIVIFVIGGLVLIVLGNLLAWSWVNGLWLRLAHLAAIGVVVGEAWIGVTCPLTTLESWLRTRAGLGSYDRGFVEHWVQRVIFYDWPPWVFTTLYTVFVIAVVAAWYYFPPRARRSGKKAKGA